MGKRLSLSSVAVSTSIVLVVWYLNGYLLKEWKKILQHLVFSCCYDKCQNQGNLGRRGAISMYKIQSILKGSQGRSSRWDPGSETMKGCHLLTCFPKPDKLPYSYNPGPLLRDGTAHCGLDPSTSTSNQKNVLQSCPQANIIEVTP